MNLSRSPDLAGTGTGVATVDIVDVRVDADADADEGLFRRFFMASVISVV